MKLVFVLCRSQSVVFPAASASRRFSCATYATYANDDAVFALLVAYYDATMAYALLGFKHASSYIKRDAGNMPLPIVVLPSKGDRRKDRKKAEKNKYIFS